MSFYCLKYAKLLKFPYLGLILSSETDIFSKKPAILTSCNCFVRVCKHTAGGLLPSPLTDRKGPGGGLRAMRGLFRHKNKRTKNFHAMRGLFRHKNKRTKNFCAMRGLFRHKNIRFLRNSWFKKNLRVICGKFSGIFTSEREQWAARQATNWSRLSPPLSMQVPHWSPTAAGRLAEMKKRH